MGIINNDNSNFNDNIVDNGNNNFVDTDVTIKDNNTDMVTNYPTDADIVFKNVVETDITSVSNWPLHIEGMPISMIKSEGGIINMVQVDWNSAVLPNVNLSYLEDNNTIITTGQLLSLINDMQGQINVLAQTISYMQGQIADMQGQIADMQGQN